ncbi:hypothetical protein HanRHA438_Chr11g0503921 [Helianthus annuus]|uniref:Uncharacterized protein n=1 Tax=Helianthus annuus TaxID=4232 RepID=A0A9K3HPP5_HELAN|nr:hypothetical protein HanXRQr2_Chr11g0491131 [Helianthus annuus]KAJ0509443.1 hypothetical protein HanIR_Chr11g0528841 [Helianthus annuus]KAJ0689418.1 hypothetical protein HanOQP8_Chr11g0405421 [Helianthus annuus]KAJ0870751.1 hypothetical protein HanRHA438_Chr11g0503921 [Helianthus annuus]KAJ0875198.1 hypothetical protein HanPSC8_Chr11g0473311 [Helianthus annuus]
MAAVLGRQFQLRRRFRSVGVMLVCSPQVAVGLAMAETKVQGPAFDLQIKDSQVLSRGTIILFS